MDYRNVAKKLKSIGISTVPLRTDESKLPAMKWGIYQDRLMTDYEIDENFKDCGGVAAVTGAISRLYCMDFDLKYQYEGQDFWKAFMDKVPKELKGKMLINNTKNKGMHIWMRTDFEAASTHLTRRLNTIPELMNKYYDIKDKTDMSDLEISERLLRNPYEVVIETRSKGSYAVIAHEDYTRFYGKQIKEFTIEEVEFLNEVAYSLDCNFTPRPKFVGDTKTYKTVRMYNDAGNGTKSLELLESSGMFSYVETERDGNITVLRAGSKNPYSGRIYSNSGVLHLFTSSSMFDTSTKDSFSPFEVYMVCKNLTYDQAIKSLSHN